MTTETSETLTVAGQTFHLPMDIRDIGRCIPHRYPFLLIDRVTEARALERVVALKNISISDPIFQGHFPGNPVFPGVLIIEAAAQAAGVLGFLSSETGFSTCFLTEVTEARFRRLVVPGDVLRLEVNVKKRRIPFYWFEAQALVGDEIAAIVKFSARMQ